MPNWNDAEDIKKWLKEQDKDKKKGTSKSAPKKPELHLKDLKPASKGNAWRRNLEESKPPPRRIGPDVESSYEAYDYDPDRETMWQRKDDLPNPQGGYDSRYRIAPDTNYQALPKFVTSQRRNPAGGYGGIREARGMIGSETPISTFGSVDPAWDYYRTPPTWYDPKESPTPLEQNPRPYQASDTPDFFHFDYGPPPRGWMENPPWGNGPAVVEFQRFSQNWRPGDDLWRRIRDTDIVPYGQVVPLGQQMHPSFGPLPESSYMDLRKYNFERA